MMLTSFCPVEKNEMNASTMQHEQAKSTIPVKNHKRSFWNICEIRDSPNDSRNERCFSLFFIDFFVFFAINRVFLLILVQI